VPDTCQINFEGDNLEVLLSACLTVCLRWVNPSLPTSSSGFHVLLVSSQASLKDGVGRRVENMHKFGGILLIGALALTGCAAIDPQAAANEACGVEIGKVSSFNDAMDKDPQDTWDAINTMSSVVVTDTAVEVPEGGAYDVLGTAQIVTNLGFPSKISWRCFSQTVDGKTYAAIVAWRRN
jgi:hypothetical protein